MPVNAVDSDDYSTLFSTVCSIIVWEILRNVFFPGEYRICNLRQAVDV